MNSIDLYIKRIFSLHGLVLIYFLLLLFFGKTFTKFSIAGPLYLHDVYLFMLTGLAINKGKLKLRFPAIQVIIALAVIYFIVSLILAIVQHGYLLMVIRQFYLFVYLACSYLIFNSLISEPADTEKPIHLIALVARVSVIIQVIFIVTSYIFVPKFSIFKPSDYNYFSPLVVMGIIVYGAYLLAYQKNNLLLYIKFFFVLLLSFTLGHSSAFFALFLIFLTYLFIRIKPLQRIIAVLLIVCAIAVLFFFPQFRDHNANWRLMYWKHILTAAIKNKYLLFGSGFGKPFMTYEYAVYIQKAIGSSGMIDEFYPMARYLSPPHNSILTIIFHIGLLPGLLIFRPLNRFFSQIFIKPLTGNAHANFLIFSLVGCLVWICFNVILELPHSSTFFWLVYFTTVYYLSVNTLKSKSGN